MKMDKQQFRDDLLDWLNWIAPWVTAGACIFGIVILLAMAP